jgi:hypothetical protein
LRGAGKEEVRFGLCPLDITALDHDRFRTKAERLERRVDLWPAPRARSEWHFRRLQLGQEFAASGSGRRFGSSSRKRWPWRAWTASTWPDVSGLASSRATARVKRPPLMPIRRWIRQPSIGRPASASARCQANTWA